jgi:hypothetical protein
MIVTCAPYACCLSAIPDCCQVSMAYLVTQPIESIDDCSRMRRSQYVLFPFPSTANKELVRYMLYAGKLLYKEADVSESCTNISSPIQFSFAHQQTRKAIRSYCTSPVHRHESASKINMPVKDSGSYSGSKKSSGGSSGSKKTGTKKPAPSKPRDTSSGPGAH